MNNNQTLCIIDMQDYFQNSFKCLAGVVDEVKHAIKNNMPILVVEYWERYGDDKKLSPTNKEIRDLIRNYKHKAYVKKTNDGGGYEVREVAEKRKFNTSNMRVVGVNRTFCVYSTVRELLDIAQDKEEAVDIEVVRGATACSYPQQGLHNLKELGVKLVNKRRLK